MISPSKYNEYFVIKEIDRMNSKQLKNFIYASLMAALTCFATYIIRVPSPTGFIHPGDSFVILSGIILGPLYGGLSAGIGSLLADILAAYPQYAIASLIIKSLTAIVCSLVYKSCKKKLYAIIVAGISAGIIVTLGYFTFEYFLYGFGAALSGVPLNIVQNLFGILLSVFLLPLLLKLRNGR